MQGQGGTQPSGSSTRSPRPERELAPRRVTRRSRRVGRSGWFPGPHESPSPGSLATVRLALIGGERLIRGATASLLGAQEGFEVQGSFESPIHFLASDLEELPGILLLDCDGDPAVARTAISVLSRIHTAARIAILCQEISQETISCAMEYRVGGVILKSYSTEDVREVIRYMASGRTVMPAGWQRVATPIRGDPLALSPRLHQILALIAQGLSNDQIATDLALSPNTIKFHVRALYARLGVRNRVEASILYAQMTRGASYTGHR